MKTKTFKLTLGLVAGMLAACGVPAEETDTVEPAAIESVEQAACSGTAGTCGANLASVDGVWAKSNGAYQGTGTSCAGSGTYGLQYQCVEFARRYWNQAKGRTFPSVSNACNICDLADTTTYKKHYASTGFIPAKGDLYVIGCGGSWPFGHVAVVTSADSTNVNTVEQNASCTGTRTYARTSARCYLRPL